MQWCDFLDLAESEHDMPAHFTAKRAIYGTQTVWAIESDAAQEHD